MKKLFFILLISIITLSACKDEEQERRDRIKEEMARPIENYVPGQSGTNPSVNENDKQDSSEKNEQAQRNQIRLPQPVPENYVPGKSS